MSFLDKPLEYIGEGNAHIVLTIADTGFVLRLIKEDKEKDYKNFENAINFVNNVMLPLLSKSNHQKYTIIHVPVSKLLELSTKLEPTRPQHRKHKSKLSCHGIVATNLLILSPNLNLNYCVEIKPKEGFLPVTLIDSPKCYYCLKQFLKLNDKQITKVSEYCPLNLFSGVKQKMKHALISLIRNPQNNLKLFTNGKLVFAENSSECEFNEFLASIKTFKNSTDVFLDFIIATLITDNISEIVISENINATTFEEANGTCVEDNHLPAGSFLHKLLCVQRLSKQYESNYKNVDYVNTEYVTKILDLITHHNLDLNEERHIDIFKQICEPDLLALISSVAKDCSIMISFACEPVEGYSSIRIGDSEISYRVAVTDVEPKSAKTLAKRKETETRILEIYRKYIKSTDNGDCCEIQPHSETRSKQLEAWEQLIIEYLKATKQSTLDVREAQNSPLFNNSTINRKLSQESIVTILEDMAKLGKAAPIDKSKAVWEVYWHSLDEWGNMVYSWACNNGMNNSVCTLFELREGDNTVDEEFHGLDMNVLIKALKTLEVKGKCELMDFDDNQGVKFF